MNSQCAFTIVAKNYIGLATVLKKSFLEHTKDADFYIIVADEIDDKTPDLPSDTLIAKEILKIDSKIWNECSFKYNITEFCTTIKPRSIEYLLTEKKYDKVIYLDPDIYCFSDLSPIFNRLDEYKVVLAPHILTLQENEYTGDLGENIFLGMGSFNLGFIAVSNSDRVHNLLKWWHRVLIKECFIDSTRFTATDQKWMDYAPMFLSKEELYITRNMGIDAAPWNFFEREFVKNGDTIYVTNRINKSDDKDKLLFVHFSSYKYEELSNGIINHRSLKYVYEDLNLIFEKYCSSLSNSDLRKYLKLEYTYNYFENGIKISHFNRRLYRGLLDVDIEVGNPFSSGKHSFFYFLKKRGLIVDRFSQVSLNKANRSNNSYKRITKIIDFILLSIFKIIGIEKYDLLCRFMIQKLRPENQTYLYDRINRG